MRARFGFQRLLGRIAVAATVLAGPATAGAVLATTFHVRTDGNDDLCNGRVDAADPVAGVPPRACAFQTPQHAVDVATAGDVVRIHAGTYTEAGATVQGTTNIIGIELRGSFISEATRLTIEAAGDGDVIFDGGGTIDTGVTIWGTSFVTIEGISFRNFTADRAAPFSFGAAAVNVSSPGAANPSSRLILSALDVRDATLDHPTGAFAEIAIWCQTCANNTIEKSTIESVEPSAIAVGSPTAAAVTQRGVIQNNTILHARDNQLWSGIVAQHTNVWRVEGNFFDEASNPDATSSELLVVDGTDWRIVNNVFHRPGFAAVHLFDDGLDGDQVEHHLVLNNTIDCDGSIGRGIRLEKCNACEIRNDLVTGCSSAIALSLDNSSTRLGFNGFFEFLQQYDTSDFATGFTLFGQDVVGDPLFDGNLPRPDPFYRLDQFSPMIDAGDDVFCADVPADDQCDIGAFQALAAGINRPPERPTITLVDNLTGKSARLHGSPFVDLDGMDTHAASQWQVDLATGDFDNPVFDSGREDDPDLLRVIKAGGLQPVTAYQARVRYQDSRGAWSPWSDPATDPGGQFTTLAATAIAPKVVSVDPPRAALDVSILKTPAVTFNVPVSAASVTPTTIKLMHAGLPVPQAPGSPSVDGSGLIVTITPAVPFDAAARYRIVVKGGLNGVRSRDGNVPGTAFACRFKTETPVP